MLYSKEDEQARGGEEAAALRQSLQALLQKMEMALVEFSVFRGKPRKGSAGSVQIKIVVCKQTMGTDDCSRAHRAITPLLEAAFPEQDLSVEVSSPGINRQIKDGVEFACYLGRGIRCWRTDITDWSAGILEAADKDGITINGREGTMRLSYEIIAKAKLDPSQEDYIGH